MSTTIKSRARCLLWGAMFLGLLGLIGCGKPSPGGARVDSQIETNVVVATAPPPVAAESPAAPSPPPDTKTCFNCQGSGTVKCGRCKNGRLACPSPCLKLSSPGWVHRNVAGHPPTDIWMYYPSGEGYNQNHAGHLIVLEGGHYVDKGPCRQCGGSGTIDCPTCKGSGEAPCPVCDGKKVVPIAWTPVDNPKLKHRPDLIQMKNGDRIFGKIVGEVGGIAYIKTADGQQVKVNVADIVSRGGAKL